MTAHLFGGVWSPSCANFALKQTAKDNINEFDTKTVKTVDCLKSVTITDEAIKTH